MKSAHLAAFLAACLVGTGSAVEPELPQLQVPPPDPAPPDGYFMHGGIVYAIVAGNAVPVDRELTLRLNDRGIIGFDGRHFQIPPGRMLTTTGRLAPVPTPEEEASLFPSALDDLKTSARPASATLTITPTEAPPAVQPPTLPRSSTSAASGAENASRPTITLQPDATRTSLPPTTLLPPPPPLTGNPPPIAPAVTSSATVPPPPPPFATPYRPDRTGPQRDEERFLDRTRPDTPYYRVADPTKFRDDQRPIDKTRPGTDNEKPRDRTQPGTDDYKPRDRTVLGPDDQRPPDPTRRPDR